MTIFAAIGRLLPLLSALTCAREQSAEQTRTATDPAGSATVPFVLEHNRAIIEIEFDLPGGAVRKARAWVDTGNQYLILAEPLARTLGFDVSKLAAEEHSVDLEAPALSVRLGGLPLRVDGVPTLVHPGDVIRPGVPAEVNLPAAVFRGDHVVFDYPQRRFTVARRGVLEPRGVGIPSKVNAETGLPMIEATIDGETVPLGIDTGSAGTWVSETLVSQWRARHPDWPHATSAAGSANFFGFPFETEGILMRLPELRLGDLVARDVGLLALDQGFFDWYSRKSAGPVSGFLGGNVLKNFRLEIDFADGMTYWEAGPPEGPADLDIVGLNLRPEADGSLTIVAVVAIDGEPVVAGVQAGDKLMRVGELDVAGATMGAVVDALRGTPGETRTLVVEREGKPLTVEAQVRRLP